MSLSPDDVKRIARLARIEISDAEARAAQTRLNAIFDLIATMQAVDTSGIVPMAHAQDVSQRLRDDLVTETDRHAAFQKIAPAVEGNLYLVSQCGLNQRLLRIQGDKCIQRGIERVNAGEPSLA